MFQLHYPELLSKIVVINCPKMFYVFWAVVKPFIRGATREKVVILGSKYYNRKMINLIKGLFEGNLFELMKPRDA